MFWWLPRNRRKVLAEADEMVEYYGHHAFMIACEREERAWKRHDWKRWFFLSRVRARLRKRFYSGEPISEGIVSDDPNFEEALKSQIALIEAQKNNRLH